MKNAELNKEYTSHQVALTKLAEKAGKILVKRFYKGNHTQISKGGVDFATNTDLDVNTFLRDSLQQLFPGDPLLMEEIAPNDYTEYQTMENVWIVDPLDGTTNFLRGNTNFSIAIARVTNGKTEIALVHMPVSGYMKGKSETYYTDIQRRDVVSSRGEIHVSETKDLKQAVIGIDLSWNIALRKTSAQWYTNIVQHVRAIKEMGSSVADLVALARGELDAYILPGPKPWDVAASSLIIEKSGGKITTPDGGPWNIFEPAIVATNGLLHEQILELINS